MNALDDLFLVLLFIVPHHFVQIYASMVGAKLVISANTASKFARLRTRFVMLACVKVLLNLLRLLKSCVIF